MYKCITFVGSLADKSCNTLEGGPNVHQQCSFPFVWKGQLHNHCAHSHTPSAFDKHCKRLRKQYPDILKNMRRNEDENEGDDYDTGITLKDENNDVITTCFPDHPGTFGW